MLLERCCKGLIILTTQRGVCCCADFVEAAGYPLENHKVITRDGYILNMYRIPHGKYRNTGKGNKPVVLLQHGVTLSSNSFVLLNANESMAYILADAGERPADMPCRTQWATAARVLLRWCSAVQVVQCTQCR